MKYIEDAEEELKRVDHLIYVSLKYTRTVDVLKNVVDRLLSTFDAIMDVVLEKAVEQNKLAEVPAAPLQKCDELRKLYPNDEKIRDYMEFYTLLRKFKKCEFTSINEYRRHVAMIAHLDEGDVELSIDIITEYYKRAKRFLEYVKVTFLGMGEQV